MTLSEVFSVPASQEEFREQALRVFRFQVSRQGIYADFVKALGGRKSKIDRYEDIPFLPVSFFKSHKVYLGEHKPELTFKSSGTSNMESSIHHIASAGLYHRSLTEGFRYFFGNPEEYRFYFLLPSYLERGDSSLVYMAKELLKLNHQADSFFLYNYEELRHQLLNEMNSGKKVILLGVSFALLDMAATYPFSFPDLIVVETGGMKGRGKEPVRDELHQSIMSGMGLDRVYSEYGMTELLSQAWSMGGGRFRCPPWMDIRIFDQQDPLSELAVGETGLAGICDLANYWSCAFILTSDLARKHPDGSFEVLGRADNSEIRGCSLMLSQ